MNRKIMTKGLPLIPLMLAMILSLSTASWARPFGGGPGGPMNLTAEQAGQLFDLKQQFMNDTAQLRKSMLMKRVEMTALWRAENPDAKQIQAKQKEMNALREQLQEKMVAFRLKAQKIAPLGPGKGMGMGPGMGRGMGMAMGGGHGMGMGPGCGF